MQQDCVLLEGADAPWKVVSAIESNGFLQVANMVFGRFASRRVYCKKRVLNVDVCELFGPFEVDTATPIRVLSDCTIFSHYPLLLALCGSNEKGDNNKRDVRLLRTAAPRCAARRAEAFRATTSHVQENNLDVHVHKTTARGTKTKSRKDDDCNSNNDCNASHYLSIHLIKNKRHSIRYNNLFYQLLIQGITRYNTTRRNFRVE